MIGRFRVAIASALILLLPVQAHAIVGGGSASNERIGQSVLTIVGSRGNFCTGALIAPKLVLTVAHCVQPEQSTRLSSMARTVSRGCMM